jgi:iron complex transport system ATP-binding protein
VDFAKSKERDFLVTMLTIEALTVAYGSVNAVQDVSLSVSSGEILALIGPNGAGKTSLIRAVSGVKSPKRGQIHFEGLDLLNLSIGERARVLAVVPQVRQMGGAFSVKQAVMMGRTPHMSWLGKAGAKDTTAVEAALAQTSLVDFAERQIASLSGGEQQRVLLARALAQSTPVLLLDEPTNHLDLQHQINLLRLVKSLTREKKLTVLMAIHDLNLVSFFADRVALLVNGKLQRLGSPTEVMQAEYIREAYQTPVEVIIHPQTGAPIIFPTNTL